MSDQEGRFEGIEEVAERLLVDPQTVRRWIKSGKLKAYKPGREYRILSQDLDAFLESRSFPKAQAPTSLVRETDEERREADFVLISSWAIAREDLRDEIQEFLDELPSLPDDAPDLRVRRAEIQRLINRFYAIEHAVNASGADRRMWPYVEARESGQYLPNPLHGAISDYLGALKDLNRDLIPKAEKWVRQAEGILEDPEAAETEPSQTRDEETNKA